MRRDTQWDGRGSRIRLIVSKARGVGKLPLLFGALWAAAISAQKVTPPTGASTGPPVARGGLDIGFEPPPAAGSPALQERMAERRNSDRQRVLVADTDRLLMLAQQLRDEVAKSNKDQLSVSVVKKSEEIEKLAKSVKEKMRGY